MSFEKFLYCAFVAILPFCYMTGCKCVHGGEDIDYCQVVQSLQIGPYDFIDERSVEIIARVFKDSNVELTRAGCSRGIGITVRTGDKNFSEKLHTISIRRCSISVVIATIAHEMGCSVTYENGVFQFQEMEDMRETDSSFSDFWSSVITEQSGQTNAVYYAGTTNGSTILFHETSAGICKWNLKNANIEKSITMPYTEDRSKWIVLKDSGEERFRHWDWRKEIEDFIQNQPRKSALVKPISTFYRVGGELSEDEGCISIVDEFSVESTLCGVLKKGDKICTAQLYDGSKEAMRSIRREARHAGNRIVGRKSRQDAGLRFAYWDKGEFVRYNELPSESFFVIDNEIVAPFEFMWDGRYDGLLEFDEKIAQQVYLKRVEMEKKYIRGEDISGTLQGVGNAPVAKRSGRLSEANPKGRKGPCFGGLLWLTVDGVIYIPCYDNNSNVTRYLNVDIGLNFSYNATVVGKGTLKLSHDSCK